MGKAVFYVHLVSVNLFLLIYLVKTILLVSNKNEGLTKFTKIVKVPEMIISTLFLISGVYLLMQTGTTKFLIIKISMVLVSIPVAIIGFKKSNKIMAVLSLLLIIGAYGLAEMNKKRVEKQSVDTSLSNASDPNYDIVKHGESIYTAYCQSCHGKGGVNGIGGTDLTLSQLAHDAKVERVKIGSGSMSGFKDVLNEQEINAVVAYVETLKK
jgi:uncharacterized membrane protein SirB2